MKFDLGHFVFVIKNYLGSLLRISCSVAGICHMRVMSSMSCLDIAVFESSSLWPAHMGSNQFFSRFEVGLFVSREGTPNTVRDTSLGLSALFLCGALCRWTAAAVLRRGGATAGLGGKVVHSSMARIAIFVMRVLAQGLALYAHASLF